MSSAGSGEVGLLSHASRSLEEAPILAATVAIEMIDRASWRRIIPSIWARPIISSVPTHSGYVDNSAIALD